MPAVAETKGQPDQEISQEKKCISEDKQSASSSSQYLLCSELTKFMLFLVQLLENIIKLWKCRRQKQLQDVKSQLLQANGWLQESQKDCVRLNYGFEINSCMISVSRHVIELNIILKETFQQWLHNRALALLLV